MNCCLCDKHFEESQFMNSSKKQLVWNAVPSVFAVPNPPPSVSLKRKLPTRHDYAEKRTCLASAAATVVNEHTYSATTSMQQQQSETAASDTKQQMVLAKVQTTLYVLILLMFMNAYFSVSVQ